ncbi:MAG: YigZ family protein [bacterium]|nr:YigZ family protein [bacterium]
MPDASYRVPTPLPAAPHQIETEVARSRFIASAARVSDVEAARAFLGQIRAEMPDASHHVYAFRVGYGASVTEGMSDDGEPTGTAGPPILAVLRGIDLGDIIVVVTRYFGGTKLGTGGLVRAYTEAAHIAINTLPTEAKIEKHLLGLEVPYTLYQPIRTLALEHEGEIQDEIFEGSVTLLVFFPAFQIGSFSAAVRDLSAGRVDPVQLD